MCVYGRYVNAGTTHELLFYALCFDRGIRGLLTPREGEEFPKKSMCTLSTPTDCR